MAETLVSAIVDPLLGKIASYTFEQVCMAWGVKNEVKKLAKTLEAIKAVLLDAEKKQIHNNRLALWLGELKDVCYDAEDVLDEFEAEALRRRALKRMSFQKKVRSIFSRLSPLVFRCTVVRRIKEIRERLDEIEGRKVQFNLTENEKNENKPVEPSSERETYSFVQESGVIGREKDREEIIRRLLSDQSSDGDFKLSVISIVGLGGLGKTTLAKLVYNDARVDKQFDLKLWVSVPKIFVVKQVIIDIIKDATGENHSDKNKEQLQKILRTKLEGKKYLLVLDDVWNEDTALWVELRDLLGGAKGSKILVTTRSSRVASIMGTSTMYDLRILPDESCLSLFLSFALKDGQERHPNLIEIGKEIVRKCGGVPLAVRTLGSLLRFSTDEKEWKRIRDSEIWEIKDEGNDILPALRLSYDQLPTHLKQCFLYCSIFPKNFEFLDILLIQHWMAHGFLQSPHGNEELENVGMRYINELRSRCFFQDFENYTIGCAFKIHDLVHDLATSLAARECLMVSSSSLSQSQSVSKREPVRHLSFVDDGKIGKDDVRSLLSNLGPQVRSIVFTGNRGGNSQSFLESCISMFQFLRVIDFQGSGIEELPENIGKLKHLRYLYLHGNNGIERLPDSFWKLQSLQSLFLLGGEISHLSGDARYLTSLRSLWFSTQQNYLPQDGIGCLNSLRWLFIHDSPNLKYLFEDIGRLRNLRMLVICSCPNLLSLPSDIICLSSLENLLLEDCPSLNMELELEGEAEGDCRDGYQNLNLDLNNGIRLNLKMVVFDELPQLVSLPKWLLQGSANTLQTLPIEDCQKLEGLPEWLQNLKSLQVLRIKDCEALSSLPNAMRFITTLQELEISECRSLKNRCRPQEGEDWPKIAHIPRIKIDGSMVLPPPTRHVTELNT